MLSLALGPGSPCLGRERNNNTTRKGKITQNGKSDDAEIYRQSFEKNEMLIDQDLNGF